MTVNYRNSAGTDLDSLFHTANNNKGAIGFKTSGGQDLGNRYTEGSLGYSVGYKNSAGTDIGYLRGNTPTESGTVVFNKKGFGTSTMSSINPSTIFGASIFLMEFFSNMFQLILNDTSFVGKNVKFTLGSYSLSGVFNLNGTGSDFTNHNATDMHRYVMSNYGVALKFEVELI